MSNSPNKSTWDVFKEELTKKSAGIIALLCAGGIVLLILFGLGYRINTSEDVEASFLGFKIMMNGPSKTPTPLPTSSPTRPIAPPESVTFPTLPPVPSTSTPTPTPTPEPAAVSIPTVSPRIVFVNYPNTNFSGNAAILTIESNGQNQQILTSRSYSSRDPNWSPDGEKIVFSANRDGDYEIYTMDSKSLPGNEASWVKLTNNQHQDRAPAWSPDGQWIAYSSGVEGQMDLYLMTASGETAARLTNDPGQEMYPSWSPDSQAIVFQKGTEGNYKLYIINIATGSMTPLPNQHTNSFWANWSPDGTEIAYTKGASQAHVNIHNLSTADEFQITHANSGGPAWSPNSSHLVYFEWGQQAANLWISDRNGQNPRKLTTNPGIDTQPKWFP